MADTFSDNCTARLINVSASTGCTLTRASIQGLTPNAFAALGFQETAHQMAYAKAQEARLAGYRENSLTTLLMSRITNIKGQLMKSNIPNSPSIILPYIHRRQKRNINWNYFKVVSGKATPSAGSGSIPQSAQDLVVTNNPSPLASTLQNLEQYFLPGTVMFVDYTNSSNTAISVQYKILAASTTGTTTTVTVQPNVTDAGWNGYTATQKLPWQIGGASGGNAQTGTTCYLGANSVSDFESWGGQDNAENTSTILNFWPQTERLVHEYTDEYLRALNALTNADATNAYAAVFKQLPLSEQKARQRAKHDAKVLNSAFYGQQINENQTVETYQKLPSVVDPANPSCVLEYKAKCLGFRTQLANCNRILDSATSALSLDSLFSTLYLVKRAREADGSEVDTIDCLTDRWTAGMIRDIMIPYYKKRYGVDTTRFYNPKQSLSFEGQVVLNYATYELPEDLGGFTLAVFWHPFFNDKLSAMASQVSGNVAAANRGRSLWFLDWSDIEMGITGTNSAVRRTNEADQLYNYTIKINIKHVTLESTSFCPIIEDPNRHYLVENFAPICPTLTVSGCTVTEPS